jgi:hypothetical protein
MKVNMEKLPGGKLIPWDDYAIEELNKFKTNEVYEVEIKRTRNPQFHGKVFSFLQFCFWHWKGDNEFQSEHKQFDMFRRNLTVLAGYREEFYKIDGSVRVEAKSLSYGSMSQSEFEDLYNALIQAALTHIFKTNDEKIYNQLLGYF